jgi:hypothetical protein
MARGHTSPSVSSDYECDTAEALLHDINATCGDTVSDMSEQELLVAVSRLSRLGRLCWQEYDLSGSLRLLQSLDPLLAELVRRGWAMADIFVQTREMFS